jgi:hypothetical protein
MQSVFFFGEVLYLLADDQPVPHRLHTKRERERARARERERERERETTNRQTHTRILIDRQTDRQR